MKIKVFSVYDAKAAYFGPPFFDQREESAIRQFSDVVNDGRNKDNQWHSHPEDFSLFMIGEFNNENGVLTGCVPQSLITASAMKKDFVADVVN